MVNKTKGTNGNLNTVKLYGVNYPLTATIKATNTGRLNAKNRYIVNSVYNGSSVGSITNTTPSPTNRVIPVSTSANVNKALSRSVLLANNIVLGGSAKTVLGIRGLNYFLSNGNITITA